MRSRLVAVALVAVAVVAATAVLVRARRADAQRIDPRRPAIFVVGAPGGASPTLRGDGRRSGFAKEVLPSGVLRIAWRKTVGLGVEQPVLAGPDGTIAVVGATRGDVIFLDGEGAEKGRVSAGSASVGLATMISDGTVVFTTAAGDAIGVRRTSPRPRFVTRIGGERNVRAAPLSLDDGGVVVATATDLVVLDAEGNVRSRVSLPESPSAALLATGDKILAVTTTGAVYGWTPGRDVVRLGSFGAPIDVGAALADQNTLVAVTEGNHLVELDVGRSARVSRSIAAQGLYLGPPSVRPIAGGGSLATLLVYTPTQALVVSIDPGGREAVRAAIGTVVPPTLADGGVAPFVAPPHTGPLVDARGAVAFASPDGHIGMVGPEGAVDTLGELPCTRNSRGSGVAGLTALGRGAFAVTCESGAVLRITGSDPESRLRPSTSVTPARSTGVPSPSAEVRPPASDDDDHDDR